MKRITIVKNKVVGAIESITSSKNLNVNDAKRLNLLALNCLEILKKNEAKWDKMGLGKSNNENKSVF